VLPPHLGGAVKPSWKRWLLPVGLIVLLVAGVVWLGHTGLLARISDCERLIQLLRREGWSGGLLCIGVQFLQVVIAWIPGEITQLAAGYVFGVWRGFLYSLIGITLGSAFNYSFARVVGRPTLEKVLNPATLAKMDASLKKARSKSAIFLLFLLPGIPKDILCYAAGLSGIGFTEFVVITGLARSPALFVSVLIGATAARHTLRDLALTALLALPVIAAYYLYERRRRGRQPPAA
jgi:uncharacterized membrane protein YdjX (TVP38/TMEM64 family)